MCEECCEICELCYYVAVEFTWIESQTAGSLMFSLVGYISHNLGYFTQHKLVMYVTCVQYVWLFAHLYVELIGILVNGDLDGEGIDL